MTNPTPQTGALALSVIAHPVVINISAAAVARRDTLLAKARAGTVITSNEGAQKVAEILNELRQFTNQIESLRVSAIAPILKAQRDINAKAGDLTSACEAEIERLRRIAGTWGEKLKADAEAARQKAWEAEQAARAELLRKEREAQEALAREQAEKKAKAEADAAAVRAKAEEEAKAAEAKAARSRSEKTKAEAMAAAEAARQKAEADAAALIEKAKQEADAARAKAEADAAARVEATAVQIEVAHQEASAITTASKVPGLRSKMDVEFTVTNIVALYEANPVFVKLEPKNAVIKSALRDLADGETLPGVTHRWVPKGR